MSDQPTVSVIMNCLNGERFVRTAIESVYAQTYPHWEIIFLDNASIDSTSAIVHNFDARIRYFRNQKTVLLGEARNQALQEARGELIAFLDVDDYWYPAKLAMQVPLFEGRPDVGLVFSDCDLFADGSSHHRGYFKTHRYKPPRGNLYPALLSHYAIPMLTTVIRRSQLVKMKEWFDNRFQVCDDYDFFMRYAYICDADYIDLPLAAYRLHSEAATAKLYRLGPMERAQTLKKLRDNDLEFGSKYGRAAATLEKDICFQQGKVLWREGNSSGARQYFLKHVLDPKFALAFGLSWISLHFLERLRWRVGC